MEILVYNRLMPHRNKILIIEHDDFLREIIGNLLHKKGGYILNGSDIKEGLAESKKHSITTVIIGTSCPDYKGKETLSYIKRELENPQIHFFVINHEEQILDFVPKGRQIKTSELSIQEILNVIEI